MSTYYNDGWNDAIEAACNLNNALTITQKNNIRKLKKQSKSTVSTELDQAITDEIKNKPKDIMG